MTDGGGPADTRGGDSRTGGDSVGMIGHKRLAELIARALAQPGPAEAVTPVGD